MRRRPRLSALPLALAALASLATLSACGGDPAGPQPTPLEQLPRDLSAAELRLIEGSNAFAFDLLRRSVAERPDSPNIFLSPLSASMALGMTANGAAGATWTQMRDALGFDGMEEPAINAAYADLIELLLDLDPGVTFALGNSVWSRQGFPFVPAFQDRVTEHFDAEARELDFGDPASVDVINGWVEDATAGRIESIIGQIDPLDIMFIINAIHFQGDWRDRFDEDRTRPAPFARADGSTVQADMMAGEVGFRVFGGGAGADGGARGVELPYGRDAFAAVAVLPAQGESVAELAARLDVALWDDWMARLAEAAEDEPEEGMLVRFPKLELEYRQELKPALTALGMVDLFDAGAADLSRLTPAQDAYVSSVLQKTFLKVDEEGTEAAAATAVTIGVTSLPPSLDFDRPFLFAIRERLSGTILFLGVIGDPAAGEGEVGP